MIKVALLAGPGAGKTTLANCLTAKLKDRGLKWYNVGEYARDFIDRWTAEEMESGGIAIPYHLAMKQLRREKNVNKNADGFVTDSPLILPWFYARSLDGPKITRYTVLSELYKMFLRSFLDYDLIVHVKREKKYVQDGTRHQSESEAVSIDRDVCEVVRSHGFSLFDVSGTTEERAHQIVLRIDSMLDTPKGEHGLDMLP
jgi:nicotinamide riboside kinase